MRFAQALAATSRLRGRKPGSPPGRALVALLGIAATALALTATPAGALVAKASGRGYGVAPINGVSPGSIAAVERARASSPKPGGASRSNAPAAGAPPLEYVGGPVMHSATTHVIYWDPNGEFTARTKAVVNGFFADVAHDSGLASNVFGVAGQYTDASGNAAYDSTFAGAREDADAYPASGNCAVPRSGDQGPPYTKCLFDTQLQSELSAYIAEHELPTGPAQLYFLLLPHKVVTCFEPGECSNNIFCAYHSYIEPGGPREIIYADIPFSLLDTLHAKSCQFDGNAALQQPNPDSAGGKNSETRFADVALKYVSHEYVEAVTDPLVGIETAWVDAQLQEIGDKCNFAPLREGETGLGIDPNAFLPVLGGSAALGSLFNQSINGERFYLQSEWDNAGAACLMQPLEINAAGFSEKPSSPIAGQPVAFAGSAADPYGQPGLAWSFGDGGTGAGPSVSHTYAAPGQYTVTMTAKDPLTGSSAVVRRALAVEERPTASFTASPNPALTGEAIAFDGSASSPPESIVAYTWDFGDGSPTQTGERQSHAYAAAGTYKVTLTVEDSSKKTGSASREVTVNRASPTIGFTSSPPSSEQALALAGTFRGGPTGASGSTSRAAQTLAALTANSRFANLAATANPKTGALTFTGLVADPGTFSWLITFENGRFGVFASTRATCKAGYVRLGGRCRGSRVVFARGSARVAAGVVRFTVRPGTSASKAMRSALRGARPLPVRATFTFQSARGGSPFSRTESFRLGRKR